ncbi:nephrin [Caerostris extrusa]|uniref:Nephrin n=1 Tax=Caerostris extrusa TaxID=172846 RepID=A0AAV4NHA1_CAEEX|nr:nephrin [Caerostris extrusa]
MPGVFPPKLNTFQAKVLGSRAYFNVSRGAFAHIKLEPVEEDDEGEYRCRIDYKRGRTLNRLVKLNVIEHNEAGIEATDDCGMAAPKGKSCQVTGTAEAIVTSVPSLGFRHSLKTSVECQTMLLRYQHLSYSVKLGIASQPAHK